MEAPSCSATGLEMSEEVEKLYQIFRSNGEGCIQEEKLKNLLTNNPTPICYDSFEPSGKMHIAEGVMKVINVNKLTSAGCHVKIWIADYCAMLSKLDADLKETRVVGQYSQEILKAAGMNTDNVAYLWASEEIINARADKYLTLLIDIATKNKLPMILKLLEILRSDADDKALAQLLYPCMQCADIFFAEADIYQLGMDQREVNELAIEYCDDIKRKNKPIILSHHMLPSLQQGLSKSDPLYAIFMDDKEADVNLKIKKAYCPPKIVKGNPCLAYIQYIVLLKFDEFTVERREEYGGNKTFKSFEDIAADYESGDLHPSDLKKGLKKALNKILQPVRDHFKTDTRAKELLEKVEKVTKAGKEVLGTASKVVLTNGTTQDAVLSTQPSSSATGLQMSEEVEKRYPIVRSTGEECIQEEELTNVLTNKPTPICYDGFEPSGRMHIAQGVMKVINVNKLTSADCRVKIWIADWFAMMNNKMGGDSEKIRDVGEYFEEVWKAVGMNNDNVEYLWSSKEIISRANEYLPLVIDIARKNTLRRILRCVQIMGRSETDELTVAQLLYPCMQCADIFFLEADICQLGMDQRKVNMLAREYCDDIKRKNKPIILSHHMLPGLQQGQEKMSKSDPQSAIFMDDEEAVVNEKIEKAYCPPKIVKGNPCLEYIQYIVLPWFDEFTVERSEECGGNKTLKSFEDIAADYESGDLHPSDLKKGLANALNKILQPVRDHFKTDTRAKELLERVKEYRVTK